MGARGWYSELMDVVQKQEASEKNVLAICAEYLLKGGKYKQCRDVYLKVLL